MDDLDNDTEGIQPTPYGHIFVIGDAADAFGAIKAGHNAYYQAEVASKNIMKLITNSSQIFADDQKEETEDVELDEYEPGPAMIKLSMGRVSTPTQNSVPQLRMVIYRRTLYTRQMD